MTSEQILKEDYSEEFDKLRKNRVVVSHYKYGSVETNYKNGLIKAIPSCEICISRYLHTGNTEYLLDAANYLMFEFMHPTHPNAYFKATDSGESAGKVGMSVNEMEEYVNEET